MVLLKKIETPIAMGEAIEAVAENNFTGLTNLFCYSIFEPV